MRLRWVGDGTDRLSWRDLLVLIPHMDGTAALAQYLTDGESVWDVGTHLLASVLDGVNAMIWQNGGGKGAKPKPIPRPGQAEGGDPFMDDESGTFEGVAMPIDELNKWLGWT